MAKAKGQPGVLNKHVYTRASYLFQAANYLAHLPTKQDIKDQDTTCRGEHSTSNCDTQEQRAARNLSRQMISDVRAMSLKGQVRQSPAMKRAICKFCDTVLIEGQNCHSIVENASKGGRKRWADVLVICCSTCGNAKRFPVCARKQKRKHLRDTKASQEPAEQGTTQAPTPPT